MLERAAYRPGSAISPGRLNPLRFDTKFGLSGKRVVFQTTKFSVEFLICKINILGRFLLLSFDTRILSQHYP